MAAIRCNAHLAHSVPPCLIDCMLGPCGPLFSACSVLVGARLTSCRPPDAATRPPRAIDSPCEVPPSGAPCTCRTKQPKLVRARMGTAAERDGVRHGEGRKAMHGGRRRIENKSESKKKILHKSTTSKTNNNGLKIASAFISPSEFRTESGPKTVHIGRPKSTSPKRPINTRSPTRQNSQKTAECCGP